MGEPSSSYAWLLAGLWLVAVAALSVFPSISDDIYFYLQLGRMWREAGHFPATEPFLFSLPGYTWHIEHEWLSYLVFDAVFRAAGFPGLVLFKTALISVPIGLLFLLCRRQGSLKLCAISAVLLFALFAGADRLMERASLFSDCLLLVLLELLYFNARRPNQTLFVVPVLFLLWVNLHPGFILGLAVLCIFAVDSIIAQRTQRDESSQRRAAQWLAVLALSAAACLGRRGRSMASSSIGWRDRLLLLLFAPLGWSSIRFVLPCAGRGSCQAARKVCRWTRRRN